MPSRISGACNACRTRKQKCSGDRSGCAQCKEAGHECTWPTQKKRGPAKGYIEGLEHRLHDAEQLLLQVLPLVNNDQLSSVTSDLQNGGSPDNRATPPLLNKKTGIDYWEQYPLDSAESIRRWQDDCVHGHRSNSTVSAGRRTSPQHGIDFHPTSRMSSKRSFDDTQDAKMPYDHRSAARAHAQAQAQAWASTYEIPKIGMTVTAYGAENAQHWQPHQQLQHVPQSMDGLIPEEAQRLFW